jgi:tetratricopeptide (TPR) repeat protein
VAPGFSLIETWLGFNISWMGKPGNPMTADKNARPARSRRIIFTAIAVGLPLVLFTSVELALRLSDAFPREPLFIVNPTFPEYSLANPRVVQRFFSTAAAAPNVSIETAFFSTNKPPGTLRIVVQGGSSAAGFPFGYGASLAGMLEQRLRREFPARHVEVISTAMSAVNSYALVDFSEEIIAVRPDAVLIYAGHNEFLGILGVGSSLSSSKSPTVTRLIMNLRRLRLYRGLENLLAPAIAGEGGTASGQRDDGTLMARIAAERRIPLGSALFVNGERQFQLNLGDLLDRYADAGIPVFVATLVSNEADQAPFIDGHVERADSIDPDQPTGDSLGSGLPLATLIEMAETGSADAAFKLGQRRRAEGDTAGALSAFQQARDLDQLRFRAPSRFNEIIRESAARHGARLVDVESTFRQATADGIIGNDLITEHLHPNVDGYFILADAFHRSLAEEGALPQAGTIVNAEVARGEIPVSGVDQHFGEYKLIRLMSDWPFTDPPVEPVLPKPATTEERLGRALYDQEIDWTGAQRRLLDFYARGSNPDEYLRVSLILADAFPFSSADQLTAGRALMGADRHLQAVRYLLLADRYRPDDVSTLIELSRACLASGLRDLGGKTLERVLKIDPSNRQAQRMLRSLQGR